MSKILFYLFFALFSFCAFAAQAGQNNYTGHDSVSVSSGVTIAEVEAIRFGNFSVTGSPIGNDAYIVLSHHGARTSYNGASTQIALLYGATQGGITNTGAQGPGNYQVSQAGASTNLYVTFNDLTGTPVAACPSGTVFLNGPPGSGQFCVDSFTFNETGTDGTGPYIMTNGSGNATILVGATLHTVSGASYPPGKYTGTVEVEISY